MKTTDTDDKIQVKYRRLVHHLTRLGRAAVAFSGGVDSSLLLWAAKASLGENVLAITVVSETTPEQERAAAARFAEDIGVLYMAVQTDELASEAFISNPEDRCYHCRRLRFGRLVRIAENEGIFHILDGENTDDLDDYRPGRRASQELGIVSPLREAGFSKGEIRSLARRLGLPVWNRPASACLASRIPFGMKITADRLRRIDRGETYLRDAGIPGEIRVRLAADRSARIELSSEGLARMVQEPLRTRVVAFFRDLGFRYVAVDLEGYRLGSLNPERSEAGVGGIENTIHPRKGEKKL